MNRQIHDIRANALAGSSRSLLFYPSAASSLRSTMGQSASCDNDTTSQVKKVLIVSTSADKMGDHTTGAWSEEITGPYYTFKDADCDVMICSIDGGDIPIDAGSLADQFKTENDKKMEAEGSGPLKGTRTLASFDTASFDIVFFCGGHGTCVDFPTEEVGAAVSKAAAAGKIIAAVCHGPMALVKATAADGKPLVAGACRRADHYRPNEGSTSSPPLTYSLAHFRCAPPSPARCRHQASRWRASPMSRKARWV